MKRPSSSSRMNKVEQKAILFYVSFFPDLKLAFGFSLSKWISVTMVESGKVKKDQVKLNLVFECPSFIGCPRKVPIHF